MNRNMVFSAGILLAFGAAIASCKNSQKATAAFLQDCNYVTAGSVVMNLVTERPTAVSGKDLPREYTVFKASNEKAFFAAAKGEGGMAAIQLPSGCRKFRLSVSETMTPQMAARYPDLVSLKGVSDDGTDLRLDWDGTTMQGQVLENGKTFLLQPRAAASGNVYLFFNKDAATTPRRAFETNAPATERMQRRQEAEK